MAVMSLALKATASEPAVPGEPTGPVAESNAESASSGAATAAPTANSEVSLGDADREVPEKPAQAPASAFRGMPASVPAPVAQDTAPARAKVTDLEKVRISGRRDGYTLRASSSGTRTPAALRDIPQSIQVIPSRVMKDQQAFVLTDVVRNIAGINQATGGAYNDYAFRGFRSNGGNFAVNGQRGALADYYAPQNLYIVDRVEAIKGPASALFSASNPGGVLNIITKKPQAQTSYSTEFTTGSFNTYRGLVDATGPLTEDKSVLYRLVVGGERSESFRDFIATRNFTVAPMITYNLSDRTSVNLEGSYLWQEQDGGGWYERGLLAPGGDADYLPISWSGHEPGDYSHDYSALAQASVTHRFTDDLSATVLGRYLNYDYIQQYHHLNWRSFNNGVITRHYRDWQSFNKEYNANAFVNYKARTGFLGHDLVGGVDFTFFQNPAVDKGSVGATNVPSLDVHNPEYGRGSPSAYPRRQDGDVERDTRLVGAYVQDLVELHPKLKALLGIRYDRYYSTNDAYWSERPDTSEASAFVPRAGLVYQPWKEISLYGSYSTSFEPQYSNLPDAGGPFDPEIGRQFEVGIKGEGRRLTPTLAVYHITKYNVLTTDPEDSDKMVENGEAVSRGVEVTLQGKLSEELEVLAAYAYNGTRTTKDDEGNEADVFFFGAPNNTVSLWGLYRIQDGPLRGLGFGGGMYHVDEKQSFLDDFKIPAYTVFDAQMDYTFRNYRLALKVNNMLDDRYYTGGWNYDVVNPGAPRNFRLTASAGF